MSLPIVWLLFKDRDLTLFVLYPQTQTQCLEQRGRLLQELVVLDKFGQTSLSTGGQLGED